MFNYLVNIIKVYEVYVDVITELFIFEEKIAANIKFCVYIIWHTL